MAILFDPNRTVRRQMDRTHAYQKLLVVCVVFWTTMVVYSFKSHNWFPVGLVAATAPIYVSMIISRLRREHKWISVAQGLGIDSDMAGMSLAEQKKFEDAYEAKWGHPLR